jgi:hypothetical protein
MISKLSLKGFKGFDLLEIPNISRIALLGGRNNVGKTSLLEALFMFHDRNNPKIAFMFFPGFDKAGLRAGALEDRCLDIVKDFSTFGCVDAYIQCLQSNANEIKRSHKTKLHAYLSGKNDFVGLKIGEGAKAGAWDWEHSKLKHSKM